MSENFTTQQRWDDSYAGLKFEVAPPGDPVRDWIESWVPKGGGTCLELGCFPGRYLAVLGGLGYELHGIDLTPRVERDLPEWLGQQGFRVGRFSRADVFQGTLPGPYDIVCSFGLIEHFGNWRELLDGHARLVRPGGLLVVSTPNFRGFIQRWLHGWLDRPNLAEHNLAAMWPEQWARQVNGGGFETLICGYFGRFDFWANPDPGRSLLQRAAIRLTKQFVPALRLLPKGVAAYAPYCGMVARRVEG